MNGYWFKKVITSYSEKHLEERGYDRGIRFLTENNTASETDVGFSVCLCGNESLKLPQELQLRAGKP